MIFKHVRFEKKWKSKNEIYFVISVKLIFSIENFLSFVCSVNTHFSKFEKCFCETFICVNHSNLHLCIFWWIILMRRICQNNRSEICFHCWTSCYWYCQFDFHHFLCDAQKIFFLFSFDRIEFEFKSAMFWNCQSFLISIWIIVFLLFSAHCEYLYENCWFVVWS